MIGLTRSNDRGSTRKRRDEHAQKERASCGNERISLWMWKIEHVQMHRRWNANDRAYVWVSSMMDIEKEAFAIKKQCCPFERATPPISTCSPDHFDVEARSFARAPRSSARGGPSCRARSTDDLHMLRRSCSHARPIICARGGDPFRVMPGLF